MDREDWNRRYAGTDLLWTAEANRFLVEEVSSLPPGRALDLAAGEGRNAVWLAERGWRVDAVDFSDVALDKGRRLADARGAEVSWIEADVETWVPSVSAYDLVILFYLHLPWVRMLPVLRHAAGALATGATLLLVGHDRDNLEHGHGGPRDPAVLYGPQDVARALSGLEILQAAQRRRPVETDDGTVDAIDCLVRAVRNG